VPGDEQYKFVTPLAAHHKAIHLIVTIFVEK